jgi:3-oxoacyl-[acyl-carrier-protein] synthase II
VLLSFDKKLIPPTAGTTVVDPEMNIDVVLGEPRPWEPGPTMSNNFGFGGHNGSIILAPYK